jgi:hypothetical protein
VGRPKTTLASIEEEWASLNAEGKSFKKQDHHLHGKEGLQRIHGVRFFTGESSAVLAFQMAEVS